MCPARQQCPQFHKGHTDNAQTLSNCDVKTDRPSTKSNACSKQIQCLSCNPSSSIAEFQTVGPVLQHVHQFTAARAHFEAQKTHDKPEIHPSDLELPCRNPQTFGKFRETFAKFTNWDDLKNTTFSKNKKQQKNPENWTQESRTYSKRRNKITWEKS